EPLLEIDKTFQVLPRETGDGSKGFEVRVAQEFKNLSSKPLSVKATFNGPTPPVRENDRTEDRQFIAGFDDDHYVDSKDGHLFLGPKERSLLKSPYYGSYPLSYDQTLVYSSGPCGWLTFGWLIDVLYGILAFFHFIFRDWGMAIIGLVCLVRLLLHPITKKSQ